ncbi:hypothetical protein ACKKBF_B31955 [Auxenochlorella protothecoides x Auxenochlorella symbiontica]
MSGAQEGASYEALQRVKTKYHRLKSRGQPDAAYQHLEAAITSQLRDRNLANADELIKMLIQAFMEEEVPVTPRIAHCFMEFWNNYADLVDSDAEALMLLDRMLEAERYLHEVGYPVEDETGIRCWLTAQFCIGPLLLRARPNRVGLALSHFAKGFSPELLYRAMLAALEDKGLREETLMAWSRIVLTYAATDWTFYLEEPLNALNEGLSFWGFVFPVDRAPDIPLVHFIEMFITSVQKKLFPLARLLLARYRPLLARDPALAKLAEKAIALHSDPRKARSRDFDWDALKRGINPA